MKKILFAFATLTVATSLGWAAPRGWGKYMGSWFSVSTPPGWKATPKKQLPSEDSAIFTAPDGRAKFTVYSPLWNGSPPDIKRNPQRETEVARRVQVKKDGMKSTVRATWITYKTMDGKWTRVVVDRENVTLNTRLTLGFAYRDIKTYNRYRKDFETFKGSLQQFSD